MLDQKAKYSKIIKEKAKGLGFLSCGIAKAGFLQEEAPKLEQWLQEGRHGKMSYMENHFLSDCFTAEKKGTLFLTLIFSFVSSLIM